MPTRFCCRTWTKPSNDCFRAREQNEPLVIFGDYDVDGVTSTALLVEVLRALGWRAEFYLPNRMDEGYGLSRDGVENCLKKFPANFARRGLRFDRRRNNPFLSERGVETLSWITIKFPIPHPKPSRS